MREPGDCNPKRRGSQYNCVFLHCILMGSRWRESVGKFGGQYEMVRRVLRTLQDYGCVVGNPGTSCVLSVVTWSQSARNQIVIDESSELGTLDLIGVIDLK